MGIFDVFVAVVWGIVEGITEWLPISSTGHMILVNQFLSFSDNNFKDMFLVVVQLGAILAVVLLFWDRIWPFNFKTKKNNEPFVKMDIMQLWFKIIISCVPAAIVGLLFDEVIEDMFYNGVVVAGALIIYGVLFIALENSSITANPSITKVGHVSTKTALFIGLFQLLSLVPGTSRSGSTILGAMVLGCSRGVAAEFSFFLGIPVMFGASFLKLVKFFVKGNVLTGPQIFYTILGMAIAFGVSVYSIQFLMGYVRRHDFKFFGYYRIILGVVVLAYFGITALAA